MQLSADYITVVAGIIRDHHNRLLLSQRKSDSTYAGYWEFPGGKIEQGEALKTALKRELCEELGINVKDSRFKMDVQYQNAMHAIHLNAFEVLAFSDKPKPIENQLIQWFELEQLQHINLCPADQFIVKSLLLPNYYAITDEFDGNIANFYSKIDNIINQGINLIQLRCKQADERTIKRLAEFTLKQLQAVNGNLLINNHADIAAAINCGWHLTSSQLMSLNPTYINNWRSQVDEKTLLGGSCHNTNELQKALELELDFVVLSPINNLDLKQSTPLGLEGFRKMIIGYPLPVYALGGMNMADLTKVQAVGGQGIAGIRCFWQ